MLSLHSAQKRIFTIGLSLLMVTSLIGCATSIPTTTGTNDKNILAILEYESSLSEKHVDSTESVFSLSDDIRQRIRDEFGSKRLTKHRKASDLARWLMCLSFSLLLVELAQELDIKLQLNQVDMPDLWGEDELEHLVFYRHVNVVYESHRGTQIFDLAMEEYKAGYPQRVISQRKGMGLLFSNIGIQLLQENEMEKAFHYLKLSASVFPENADMWINLGAAYKQVNEFAIAEKVYLKALSIKDTNSLAASNLERIYRDRGQLSKSRYFAKRAKYARQKNPYIQYRLAKTAFESKEYSAAKKAIKRAIRLHGEDPKFYELSSKVNQVKNNYVAALKDLHKAQTLSQESLERGRYAHKFQLVARRAKEHFAEQQERRKRQQGYEIQNTQVYRGLGETL